MHPYWAGYRTPHSRQILILVLSALAGVIVSGIYMWGTILSDDGPAAPVRGNVVRHIQTPEESASILITCVLFFGTVYATGMALYRYFGDTEGYTVVSANAGQHMPLVFLVAGGALAGVHGTEVYEGRGRVFDWLMLAIGLGLLAISAWGLYRATVVNRQFYRWFYGLRKDRPSKNP
jgi:hypothetical protein